MTRYETVLFTGIHRTHFYISRLSSFDFWKNSFCAMKQNTQWPSTLKILLVQWAKVFKVNRHKRVGTGKNRFQCNFVGNISNCWFKFTYIMLTYVLSKADSEWIPSHIHHICLEQTTSEQNIFSHGLHLYLLALWLIAQKEFF